MAFWQSIVEMSLSYHKDLQKTFGFLLLCQDKKIYFFIWTVFMFQCWLWMVNFLICLSNSSSSLMAVISSINWDILLNFLAWISSSCFVFRIKFAFVIQKKKKLLQKGLCLIQLVYQLPWSKFKKQIIQNILYCLIMNIWKAAE